MTKRIIFESLAFSLFFVCFFNNSFASGNKAIDSNSASPNCGLELSVPAELDPNQDSQSDICVNSYLDSDGTVLLLGALLMGGQNNPYLLEAIPALWIYSKSIESTLSINNGSGIQRTSSGVVSGVVESMDKSIENECSLNRSTQLSEISGSNWKGWIAEDSYQKTGTAVSSPDYCERYSMKNRCVRMIIGNSKESAVMAQYCLTRLDEDFDLNVGLSYNIFLKLIKSIRFSEG